MARTPPNVRLARIERKIVVHLNFRRAFLTTPKVVCTNKRAIALLEANSKTTLDRRQNALSSNALTTRKAVKLCISQAHQLLHTLPIVREIKEHLCLITSQRCLVIVDHN